MNFMGMMLVRILKTLVQIPNILVATYYVNSAWELFRLGEYERANLMFVKGKRKLKYLPLEYQIIKGKIRMSLKFYAEAADILRDASSNINNDGSISIADSMYLREYIYSMLCPLSKLPGIHADESFNVEISDVNLNDVSTSILKRFPPS
jgi:tetratricopeptide (TPR) repeat protein